MGRLAHAGKPVQQGRAIRQHQARDPARKDLAAAGQQMELALPDIDPHIVGAGIDEGIAGEAEAGHVKQRGQALSGDGGVDMSETDDVADVLGRAIEMSLFHGTFRSCDSSPGVPPPVGGRAFSLGALAAYRRI